MTLRDREPSDQIGRINSDALKGKKHYPQNQGSDPGAPDHPAVPDQYSGRPGKNFGDTDASGNIKDGVKTPAMLPKGGEDRKLADQ